MATHKYVVQTNGGLRIRGARQGCKGGLLVTSSYSANHDKTQARNQRGAVGQLPPKNFHKRMYLLGAPTSYIILPPRKYQLVAALIRPFNQVITPHFSGFIAADGASLKERQLLYTSQLLLTALLKILRIYSGCWGPF